jgi:hypothetical protein
MRRAQSLLPHGCSAQALVFVPRSGTLGAKQENEDRLLKKHGAFIFSNRKLLKRKKGATRTDQTRWQPENDAHNPKGPRAN